ncbi:heavy metal transporter CzcB [Streptomyces sp. CRN 30]|uniref:heavy metal transporter CzcB n=1 Tax=Streptomyces sp. CRN 30 TaxID=3075613 RepID=UPI0039C3A6EB
MALSLLPDLPLSAPPGPGGQPGRTVLSGRVDTARRLLYACDYAALEQTLPHLIGDLRHAAAYATEATEVLAGLLATAYQTATSLLVKQRDQGHAWLAAGRAMAEAERSGDPVILASSIRVQAHVLAREKHTAQAVTLVRHTAGQMTGSYDRRSPAYLAALGLLLLRGVTAAGAGGDRASADGFLSEAKEVARYVSVDRPDAWANFDQANVAVHEVSALVAFGDAGTALRTARSLRHRPLVAERRAAVWVETARAHSQLDRPADAYRALRVAETCAAQEVHRPEVRDLVAEMVARDRHRTVPGLHAFGRRLGAAA